MTTPVDGRPDGRRGPGILLTIWAVVAGTVAGFLLIPTFTHPFTVGHPPGVCALLMSLVFFAAGPGLWIARFVRRGR
jgi:hypothetical protein